MKRILIWIDILGFKELPEKIYKKTGVESQKVRDDFLTLINKKIKDVREKRLIIGRNKGRDDWILVAEDLQKALLTISEILDHNTRYTGYEKIPLEIAIGCEEYDRWAEFDGKQLICEDKTIDWLKTNIVGEYRDQYKKERGESIKETFVLISDSVYMKLKNYQKEECKPLQLIQK